MEVMHVTGGSWRAGWGAGRVLHAPVSKGGICRRCRGKCAARSRAPPGNQSSRFLWGCSFQSANRERETWEPGRCLRPCLQVHRVGALRLRGEGAAETEGCPCCSPSKHLPTRVRFSSPHAVSAAPSGLFEHRPTPSRSRTLSPEAWTSLRHHARIAPHLPWVYL